jgi:hypothetical protein
VLNPYYFQISRGKELKNNLNFSHQSTYHPPSLNSNSNYSIKDSLSTNLIAKCLHQNPLLTTFYFFSNNKKPLSMSRIHSNKIEKNDI